MQVNLHCYAMKKSVHLHNLVDYNDKFHRYLALHVTCYNKFPVTANIEYLIETVPTLYSKNN